MRQMMFAGLIALGLGTITTTATAQEKQYHPRYRGDIQTQVTKPRQGQATVTHGPRVQHGVYRTTDKDPKAIAINKTADLDRKVQLTTKQERKVQRLYKKEAKQMVKLQEIRKENRVALKDILTKEQHEKVRHTRPMMIKGKNKRQVVKYTTHPRAAKQILMKANHPAQILIIQK